MEDAKIVIRTLIAIGLVAIGFYFAFKGYHNPPCNYFF